MYVCVSCNVNGHGSNRVCDYDVYKSIFVLFKCASGIKIESGVCVSAS